MPLFGLDSLIIDSSSTSIEGKNYWYMNTAADGLFNVNGYIRESSKIVYLRAGDKSSAKNNNEQVLFDFSGDTIKNWVVHYERNNVTQSMRLAVNKQFYNTLIKDSAFIFNTLREEKSTSWSKDFLIQASLRKGLISFKYLDKSEKKIYTIDYLPSPKVMYDTVAVPLYQDQ